MNNLHLTDRTVVFLIEHKIAFSANMLRSYLNNFGMTWLTIPRRLPTINCIAHRLLLKRRIMNLIKETTDSVFYKTVSRSINYRSVTGEVPRLINDAVGCCEKKQTGISFTGIISHPNGAEISLHAKRVLKRL